MVRLGDLVDVKGGKRLPKGTTYAESCTDHAYVRVTDFEENSVGLNSLVYIDNEVHSKISRYVISSEDVYISIAGTIGLVGTIPKEIDGANLTENAAKLVIKDKLQLDKNYLVRFLASEGQKQIHERKKTTSQPKLALFRIEEIEIPLPYPDDPEKSLKEQKRIAAILDKADGIRRKRQQAIQLADDFLRSVFLDMFGDPVTNPKGWEVKNIEDACTDIVDCINKTAKTVDFVTPYKMIRTTNIRNYELDLDNCRFVEKDVYEKWISRLMPEKGDIFFTREAPAGEAAIYNTDEKVFLGQRTMHFRPDLERVNSCYLLYEMMGVGIKHQMDKMSSGSTVKHLSVPECKKFKIRVPPLSLQNKFKNVRDKILKLQEVESKSFSIPVFESLSQKAFKGEL